MSRVDTKEKRRKLYQWAKRQKGPGSLKRIGKKMASIKKTKGRGVKTAVIYLGIIATKRKAFLDGLHAKPKYGYKKATKRKYKKRY